MYEKGQSVAQDYAAALNWYRKAADQGNAPAQNNLGVMYAQGRGAAQDYTTAVSWYRKAADQGNAPTQNNLAVFAQSSGANVQTDVMQQHVKGGVVSSSPSGLPRGDMGPTVRDPRTPTGSSAMACSAGVDMFGIPPALKALGISQELYCVAYGMFPGPRGAPQRLNWLMKQRRDIYDDINKTKPLIYPVR